jgi:predicted nucleotidyltransferase
MTRFEDLLRALTLEGVEFVLAGGLAAAAHGSSRATQDIDIVYDRSRRNLERLVRALEPHRPYLRGAPPGLPFRLDVPTLTAGLNFTLTTELGWIDLLGEISGGGGYTALVPHSVEIDLHGVRCKVLDLEALIRSKRAAGRPKDFEAIAELEILRERRGKNCE